MSYDLMVYVFFSVLVVGLGLAVFFFRNRYRKAVVSVAQLILDKEALLQKLDILTLENSKEANEGFIKFLSDSRQDAFDYIEGVQLVISNYLSAVESGDEDGIVTARMELFSYLPEESEAGDKNQG